MKKQRKTISPQISLLRPFLIIVFIGFFGFVGARKAVSFVKSSPYFKVNRITCSSSSRARSLQKFLYLRNESIFDVKISGLQKQLEWLFPEAEQVRVFKRFPDEILIVFKDRTPYAAVLIGSNYFLVDRQGFMISKETVSQGMFPLIRGLPSIHITPGQRIVNDQLQTAFNILGLFSQNKALHSFAIVKIDVGNMSRISFYLGDQLEVVVDREKILEKMNTLGVILERAKLDWERIRYIDLRFQEPVVKYDI